MQRRLATHNVVAVHDTFEQASEALDALMEAGFEARGELSMVGPEHEMRPAVERVTESRGEASSGTASGLAAGVAGGTVAGAGFIALAAAAATVLPGVGMTVGAAAVAGAVAGGTGGGTVGGLLGLEAAGRRATMWQQTLSPLYERVKHDGIVLVAVHVDDEERARRAREVLEATATEVHELTADIDYEPELREANVGTTIPSGSAADAGGAMGPGKHDHPQPEA